ncbi:D-tagatose-bisphosphate aldolase, class II, non-catalytic subunit ['Osedax' symbiont bacterium Rs2_46_30_T18]|nr:D-tagatose-bisphosphate aldolase, class II, non-catalytic subunit ['Osedax' symbiont bacterium Rs2_46_30_T18]
MSPLLELIERHKAGTRCGIYAVCSANSFVLEAAILQAKQHNSLLLVEATSNQVNQYGGYTGMLPEDFRQFIQQIATRLDFPLEQLILGGDHLGPNCWQLDSAEIAMQKSAQLIEAYVAAGFEKIHLDCSMACADDTLPLEDSIIAQRAAQLCLVAETTYANRASDKADQRPPLYVIGTEVPVPGGAQEDLATELEVTSTASAAQTIQLHCDAFGELKLPAAWQRTIALVVQPGVEFDHQSIISYQSEAAQALSTVLDTYPNMVFEAHSTDYQSAAAYKALVSDHFAILKVGPALTFALREVLFSLSDIEQTILDSTGQAIETANLKNVLEQSMLDNPEYWQPYYQGSAGEQKFSRQYSLSDRCRYYWPQQEVQQAVETLLSNLNHCQIPIALLSQYLPVQYQAIVQGELDNAPQAIIYHHIQQVTAQYASACSMGTDYE